MRERQALELHALVHEAHEAPRDRASTPACRRALPLQSNPHMHLFEAALAGCRGVLGEFAVETAGATKSPSWRSSKFIDPDTGALREFFDEQWNPAPGIPGRIVEPGHQFEWAWLLLRWGGAKHARARQAALKLIEMAETHGVRNGLAINSLLDDFSPHDAGARLWPQTERLKAAAIAARLTGEATLFLDGCGGRPKVCCAIWTSRCRALVRPHRPAGPARR